MESDSSDRQVSLAELNEPIMASNHDCFCELAPFYALGTLSEVECQWVEQHIAEYPELAEELAEYEAAVVALPYGAPPVALASSLKDRLFSGLGLTVPVDPEPKIDLDQQSVWTVRSQDLQWQPHPTPGVQIAIFHTNPLAREISGVLKAEPGVVYPRHRHAAVEEIYMLEGDLIVEEQTYGAGDYIRSQAGSIHAPHTIGGCKFFFRTSMDDEYDPAELS